MTQANSNRIIEKIFSSDFFKNVNTAVLVKQYDISSDLRLANSTKRVVVAPKIQTSPDISSIPTEGIIIITPGKYQFLNNITWTPLDSRPAILIQSDDV
ncbi:MAG TPA: hypothetical protein VK671_09375, partial [Mucilaginibacter sp.]|nr:hypothetical protein [Mucilaginibacter sp.]